MAVRGTPAMQLRGNALGGVLRDLNRRTRSTTKRRGPTPKTVEGQRGERGRDGRPGTIVAAALKHTDEDGYAEWEFPKPYGTPPVVGATAVSGGPAVAVIDEVTGSRVRVRVWNLLSSSASGVIAPVGGGITVHLTACPPGR